LTSYKRRAVIGGTMATAEALPFRVELNQVDYLELLKQAKRQTRVSCPRLSGR